jgi:cell pole-organizing protein PopZ
MEDILASIRRILSEDEVPAATGATEAAEAPPPAAPTPQPADDGVLVLDPAMMVPDPVHEATPLAELPPPPPQPPPAIVPPPPVEDAAEGLVAPEAAAAAASSMGSLMRTLAMERSMQVRSGGPTIEDIVREEIRPLLKSWLDANLPPIVERLVRTEIERVVSRVVP